MNMADPMASASLWNVAALSRRIASRASASCPGSVIFVRIANTAPIHCRSDGLKPTINKCACADRAITQCPKDYKIFSQGDPADSVFYIQEGRVKLKVKSKQGK